MYSQLPSIAGGHPSIHNLRIYNAVVIRDPPNMDSNNSTELIMLF
jgi:hypothetical protein